MYTKVRISKYNKNEKLIFIIYFKYPYHTRKYGIYWKSYPDVMFMCLSIFLIL